MNNKNCLSELKYSIIKTYTIYSLGWHTVVATPPIVHHGLTTVWPPVTAVPASRAESWGRKQDYI